MILVSKNIKQCECDWCLSRITYDAQKDIRFTPENHTKFIVCPKCDNPILLDKNGNTKYVFNGEGAYR